MLRTHIEGERFLHRELWRVVERQLEHASSNPQGALYDDLVAMVFSLHTLEAYLNFAGERLAPEIWKDERNFFRNEPYRGFQGKLRKVLELAGMPTPDITTRPYSTIELLKELRDLIAHAKPEKFSRTIDHPADEEPNLHNTPLDEIITHDNARMAKEDMKQFIELLHSHAKGKANDVWFKGKALTGPLQYSSGHTSRAT